jgi:sugar/nucleoside kinase (ribokinase family)
MPEVWTMGEMLVEIMRPRPGMQLAEPGEFLGPYPSGAPSIFIDTIAQMGHGAGIIGGLGRDDFGACILKRLQGHSVDVRFVEEYAGRSTAVAFVAYAADGSRKFIYHIDGTPAAMPVFPRAARPEVPWFFHVMGCSLMINSGFRAAILDGVEYFHERGAKISFDPNIRPELLGGRDLDEVIGPIMRRCSILFPGVAELQMLGGGADVTAAAGKLFGSNTLELIVLKRGRQGATLITRSGKTDVPAFPIKELDPTGAGDSFDAGFLCGMLENQPLEECAKLAAAAGALNAAAFGPMEGDISHQAVRDLITSRDAP